MSDAKAVTLRSQPRPVRLDVLAATARQQHGQVQALRRTLESAIACGEALIEARELVPAGMWHAWLAANVGVHRATAQWYARVVRFRDELSVVGVESFSEAQTYLRQNQLSEEALVEIRLLGEQGISHRDIARRVGVGKTSVSRVLRQPMLVADRDDRPVCPSSGPMAGVEITDAMVEGMARWLAVRMQRPLTDRTRHHATEALGVALNYQFSSSNRKEPRP